MIDEALGIMTEACEGVFESKEEENIVEEEVQNSGKAFMEQYEKVRIEIIEVAHDKEVSAKTSNDSVQYNSGKNVVHGDRSTAILVEGMNDNIKEASKVAEST